jgi:hypothetical protein
MRLENIIATGHPLGNRIDITWVNPDPDGCPGVRVVRREGAHPTSPEDGVLVTEGEHLSGAVDENLKGETVYYYTLFPYGADEPRVYQVDKHNRTAAMATAPYDMAGQMAALLPNIYHRYDTTLPSPDDVAEADRQKGQLRRFLELPGSQLDRLHSLARAALDLWNLDSVDGRLLPLLAQWIGWQTDYRQEIDAQRSEIRNAPAIYDRIGIIPTVEATVKRILGWESRTKEFVHNVFFANRPERLNLWTSCLESGGAWSEPREPLSLDFAYEGRPAAVEDGSGTLWLFYHTQTKEGMGAPAQWDIRYKTLSEESWAPSQSLTHRARLDKSPTAVARAGEIWVFWESFDTTDASWRIAYRIRQADGEWSAIDTYGETTGPERRRPQAVVDGAGDLWLFWLEKVGARWRLRYARHTGPDWADDAAWGASSSASDFPLDDNGQSAQTDIFAFITPDAGPYLFWSRRVTAPIEGNPHRTLWRIAYRLFDPASDAFGDCCELPGSASYDCREPAALWNVEAGRVELFCSANQEGGWSIWHGALDDWGTAAPIMDNPYSERAPLPVARPTGTLLIYGSNKSLNYQSQLYAATETLDARYAGSTTVDTRNLSKIVLQEQYEDFQTYTYDAGQTYRNWYARDTIGIYLTPDTDDYQRIVRNQNLIKDVLKQFLPIQVRVVFIIPLTTRELIYTYDFPDADPRLIGEQVMDATLPETYLGLEDSHERAVIPGLVLMRSWGEAHADHLRLTAVLTDPPDTRFRTWHEDLEMEDDPWS